MEKEDVLRNINDVMHSKQTCLYYCIIFSTARIFQSGRTKLSSSGSSLKKGLCSRSCWCTKFSMSTSKLADVMHSDPCVACSHFSNNSASKGNSGCLWRNREGTVCVDDEGHIRTFSSSFISNVPWHWK